MGFTSKVKSNLVNHYFFKLIVYIVVYLQKPFVWQGFVIILFTLSYINVIILCILKLGVEVFFVKSLGQAIGHSA